MKISFKTISVNRVSSDNTPLLKEYIISESGLNAAREIARLQNQSVFDLLSHKKLFIALDINNDEENPDFRTCMTFIVRRNDGTIMVWSNRYLTIEDGDAIFTTKEECDVLCDELNAEFDDDGTDELAKTQELISARMQENRKCYNEAKEFIKDVVSKPGSIDTKLLTVHTGMLQMLDDEYAEQSEAYNTITKMIENVENGTL